MFTDDQLLPISALQHYLFCPRQAALIHLEQAWAENRFTAEGNALHDKTHDGPDESRPGVRITRSLPVVSHRLGLAGQCDVVEFHADGTVIPVEYKRGKPKVHAADGAQLCAQAMCLEEMLGVDITEGFLFNLPAPRLWQRAAVGEAGLAVLALGPGANSRTAVGVLARIGRLGEERTARLSTAWKVSMLLPDWPGPLVSGLPLTARRLGPVSPSARERAGRRRR